MNVTEDAYELLHFFYEEIIINGKQIVDTEDVVNKINWSSNKINSSFNYLKAMGYLVIGQMGIGNIQGVQIFRIMGLSPKGIEIVENKFFGLNTSPMKQVMGGTGITAGGNVTIGNVSGQLAIGQNITQTQTFSASDKKELLDSLRLFQKEAAKIGIPEAELSTVNGDLNAAIKEAEKEKPDASKIKGRFEGALDTIKEVGDTIEKVSKWEWTGKIVKILGKLGLSILL